VAERVFRQGDKKFVGSEFIGKQFLGKATISSLSNSLRSNPKALRCCSL